MAVRQRVAWAGAEPASTRCPLELPAPAVMERVDRALGLPHALRDLRRREPDQVAQDDHLALILGQVCEGGGQRPAPVLPDLIGLVLGSPHLLGQHRAASPQVVDGRVAGDSEQPSRERNAALLVALDPASEAS